MAPTKKAAPADPSLVLARPTKEFFVSMLVRDIELLPAVVDLVDNSVDGARRHKPDDYEGLYVHITADKSSFRITDNCGGIPIDVARRYAFRFGRERGVQRDKHSIGQFGVGMKRALFKLGTAFTVVSRTTTDSFDLEVSVDDWLLEPDLWDFHFTNYKEKERRAFAKTGTEIVVSPLHLQVRETFGDSGWQAKLGAELRLKHRDALTRGLVIELNGRRVEAIKLDLVDQKPFRPSIKRLNLKAASGAKVTVQMICGLSSSEPQLGGWYVFCNGRMILGPDQEDTTVWIGKSQQGLPRYHDEYARFRGYVFFDSDDAAALPWTTTKVGVDGDSRLWQGVRSIMQEMSKPVIKFLRDLDRTRDEGEDAVYEKLAAMKPVPLHKVSTGASTFHPPAVKVPPAGEKPQRIAYHRSKEQVNVAKRLLKVTTTTAVGEKTFDYFMDAEYDG